MDMSKLVRPQSHLARIRVRGLHWRGKSQFHSHLEAEGSRARVRSDSSSTADPSKPASRRDRNIRLVCDPSQRKSRDVVAVRRGKSFQARDGGRFRCCASKPSSWQKLDRVRFRRRSWRLGVVSCWSGCHQVCTRHEQSNSINRSMRVPRFGFLKRIAPRGFAPSEI